MSRHVGVGRHRELGGQVQSTGHTSSYCAFYLHIRSSPRCDFWHYNEEKSQWKVRAGFMVALTWLVLPLQEQTNYLGKMGPGVCFMVVAFGFLIGCSTAREMGIWEIPRFSANSHSVKEMPRKEVYKQADGYLKSFHFEIGRNCKEFREGLE